MIVSVLNMAAGGVDDGAPARVAGVFEAAGVPARVIAACSGEDVVAAAKEAASDGASVVAAGGGDGTVSTVAAVLAGTGVPLGVLPLGTLNHFAKDLGIPADLEAAAGVIANGRIAAVDVGDVNGHVFVNNSSLGLYATIVRQRELRQALGWSKWPAFASATVAALRWHRNLKLRIEVNGKTLLRRTPFVFIGNNVYEIQGPDLGSRASLTGGQMCVLVLQGRRFHIVRFAMRALCGRLDHAGNYDALCATELWIESRRPKLQVAVDGEVTN
jgi:diacylglycerol kinase family enzyme